MNNSKFRNFFFLIDHSHNTIIPLKSKQKISLFLLIVVIFFISCGKTAPVKDTNVHNYFALREITLGKENTLYLSTRSAYIPKEDDKVAFEKFQDLHAENKIKRSYWKCNLKNNSILECSEELQVKEEPNEIIQK